MANEFIARNGITSLGNIVVSGSITTTGTVAISGSIASASFAATASSADNFLTRGTLTAQTLVVQTITSSVDFVTGSTRFGSTLANTHVFSGSVSMNPGGLFVSSSNVGIGTSTPTAKLQIIAPESTSGLDSFGVIGQNSLKSVQLGATSSYAWIQSHGSVPLRINELGNNVLIATGGANVGIGITNPSTTLHVAGTNNTAVSNSTFWSFAFAGQEITNLSNTTGTVAGLALLGGAGRSAVSAIGNILESTTLGALGFFTGGSGVGGGTVPERMRITSDGYLRLASRGIQFNGDTSDANSLDDYEEGNWTPVYQDSTSTPSYIVQFGRYTKIGRLVHLVGKISASNLGGGNAIIIGGLPFSAADASDAGQRCSIRPEGDWSGLGSLFTTTLFRVNGANFQGVRDNGSGQSIFARYNEYSSTLYFNFNATYYV